MKKHIFTLLFLLGGISLLSAQELTVKEFKMDTSDNAAIKYQVKDSSGDPCALIMVGLTLANVEFEGDIVKQEQKENGEYWIYLMQGANWLEIKTKKYLPLRYEFEDVQGNTTYIMQIDKPQIAYDGPTGTVNITSNVHNAEVYVDGEKLSSITPFGYKGPEGEHIVELKAPGYNDERSTIRVELNQKLKHHITMRAEGSFSVNNISYEMIQVPGGTFFMGSSAKNSKQTTFNYEQPVHEVTLRSYSIGKTEVPQALWEEIMGSNPSIHKGGNFPVENVTWSDCQEFITKLNERCGTHFRLPTEAEWEYAARGCGQRNSDEFAGGSQLGKVAHLGVCTLEVGMKQANELGIQDMSGNVAEWCDDWLGKYTSAKALNPSGPKMGVRRIVRGGSFKDDEWYLRTAARGHQKPGEPSPTIGLRLAQDL